MDFQIVWTEPALGDLQEIVAYIARDDAAAAARVGNDIVDHVETLRTFPFIGPAYPRGSRGNRREIVCGNYRIFYRVSEPGWLAEILTIWHGARGTPEFGWASRKFPFDSRRASSILPSLFRTASGEKSRSIG